MSSPSPPSINLGVAQSHTRPSTSATLTQLSHLAHLASTTQTHLLLFPEAYLGGYPRTATFGSSIGSRSAAGREQFLAYFRSAVDLGDVPDSGSGEAWVERRLGMSKGGKGEEEVRRGDGTREELERIARETGVFLVVGVIERAGGSLYCAVVYVDPARGCIGKRRKVMPTGTERVVWGQGSTATLKAVKTRLNGVEVTLAAAVCWENFMPLLRFSLYSQGVSVWLAPTADARATWVPLMQTIAAEGRCFVLSANQCVRRDELPGWIKGDTEQQDGEVKSSKMTHTKSENEAEANDIVCRGGSCIIAPSGEVLAGPLWDAADEIITATIDIDDCIRGKLDFDVAGSYSRMDSFDLKVKDLDLNPPP